MVATGPCDKIPVACGVTHAQEEVVKFASVRIIAADIGSMVAFYEMVTGIEAQWLAPVFAEIVMPGATLAIGSVETVALWKEDSAEPAANRSLFIEFQVEDIQSEYARLKDDVVLVHELKTMPWGNMTFQFRDPENNAVSLYMPASDAAKHRFTPRSVSR
jgi:predicted enzyme related to lactoylglutathione lyase